MSTTFTFQSGTKVAFPNCCAGCCKSVDKTLRKSVKVSGYYKDSLGKHSWKTLDNFHIPLCIRCFSMRKLHDNYTKLRIGSIVTSLIFALIAGYWFGRDYGFLIGILVCSVVGIAMAVLSMLSVLSVKKLFESGNIKSDEIIKIKTTGGGKGAALSSAYVVIEFKNSDYADRFERLNRLGDVSRYGDDSIQSK